MFKPLLLATVVAFPLFAQRPPIPGVSETIEVSIVNLDVIVTDRNGERVRGLTSADFEVKENGKVRTITNFAEYAAGKSSAGTEADAPPAAGPEPRRIIVFFIERARLTPPAADRIFGTLEEAVRRVVRPGDAAAVAYWDQTMRLELDFTDDVDALSAALRKVREINKGMTLRDRSMNDRLLEQERLNEMLEGTGASLDIMSNESIMLARRALMQIRAKSHALRSLIGVMAPNEGKKILFTATRRLSAYAGAEYFEGGNVPFEYRGELDTAGLARGVADAANAAGVTIYPVYAPGLVDESSLTAADQRPVGEDAGRAAFDWNVLSNEAVALDDLARSTGGLYASGAADIAAMIPKLVDDIETYYSIAFRAEPGERKERRISVRALHRDYTVRARRSYVQRDDRERMADRVVAHLFWPSAPNRLGIRGELIPVRSSRNRTTVQARIHIPIAQLSPLRQGEAYSGAFTVFATAGGRNIGVVSEVMQRTQSFRIPAADLNRARSSRYTYDLTVVTDDLAEYVSIGVMDEISKEFSVIRLPLAASSTSE